MYWKSWNNFNCLYLNNVNLLKLKVKSLAMYFKDYFKVKPYGEHKNNVKQVTLTLIKTL